MNRRMNAGVVVGLALMLAACGGEGGGSETGGTSADADPFGNGGSTGDAGPEGGGGTPTGGNVGGGGGAVGGNVGPDLDHCADDTTCPAGYFCNVADGAAEGACKPGCRQDPNDCNEPYLCDDTRMCVLDMHCANDLACPPDTWCNAGDCVPGCKVIEPELCPLTMEGQRQICDPATHACVVGEVCCANDDACTSVLPGTCRGEVLPGQSFCVNPNPCEGRCEEDDDCSDESYCDLEESICKLGCRPDSPRACGGGQFCNADSHLCEFRSCNADAECPPTQFCTEDGEQCTPGCRRDPDNCPQGSYCQENRECGMGCATDELCIMRNGAGWYCQDQQCHAPCARHDDCADEQFCDAATERCEAGCRDDAQEPNNVLAEARALVFEDGTHYDSGPVRLAACELNSDFFRFDVAEAGWSLHPHIDFVHGLGDLDLRLYDADGNAIAESARALDDEDIVWPPAGSPVEAPAGRFYLEVLPRGLSENTYRLTIDIVPPGGCLPDEGESAAGDDSAINATPLSLPQQQQQVTVDGHSICPGDDDWYAVRMGARDGVSIRLEAAAGMGDLDFAVFGPGAPTPDEAPVFTPSSFAMEDDGRLVYGFEVPRFNAAVQDGVYYIRIAGSNPDQTARYALTVSVDRDRALCQDDVGEPNDALNRSFDLMSQVDFVRPRFDGNGNEVIPDVDLTLADLWLCSGEQDWFRIDMTANDELVARVIRAEADLTGDMRIDIRDARGQTVGLAGRNNQPENLARARQLAAGTYYISVVGIAMTQSQYSLVINRTTSPVPCQEDDFEAAGGNEVQANSAALPFGTQADLTLCGADADEDWYVVETDGEGTLNVALNFLHSQGDLDVDIIREGAPLAENAGTAEGHGAIDGETVQLRNRPASRYFIHVYANGNPNTRYDLDVTFEPREFMCSDDPDEPNGSSEDATYLGVGQVNGRGTQWVCDRAPRDEDWFQIDVAEDLQRTVLSTFTYGDDGDLFLEIYDDDMMLRAATSEISRGPAKQCIIIEDDPSPRTFFVRVMPLAVNTVLGDERLDYQMYLVDGDNCDLVGLPSIGVEWPRVD